MHWLGACTQAFLALAPGRCRGCHNRVHAGDQVLVGPGGWGYIHEECPA
jgi:hypothetical protein